LIAIKIKNLTKTFAGFKAVNDLSLELSENRVLGFLGPNGAGKTTSLRMLVGLSRPTGGEIEIAGEKVIFGRSTVNKFIGYLPEQPSFYGWMTGKEYLGFVADIFGLKNGEKESRITELLKKVGLTASGLKKIATYSNGMKQRLGIAQAIINDPKVLIMDEPVSALDPIGRREVLSIINNLKKQMTILLSTHILADVDRVCDDIAILNRGKLIISSSLENLKANYASLMIEVELDQDSPDILKKLSEQPWATKVEKNNQIIKIWIKDREVMSKNIALNFFAKENVGVLNFGLKLPEVEDLFVSILEGQK
jgi:ABC-2 type transport system ATP-binding protein